MASVVKGKIQISTGALIRILVDSEDVEILQIAPNKFISVFEEDDIDFQLEIRNSWLGGQEARGLSFSIETLGKQSCFYIPPNGDAWLETLESEGGKLHFVSQKSNEGTQLLSLAQKEFNISQNEASEKISRMEIKFEAEVFKESPTYHMEPKEISLKGAVILVDVKTLTGKTLSFNIGIENTIEDFKWLIANQEGIPIQQQRLIFAGKQLEDLKTFADDYPSIRNGAVVHLVLRIRGGGSSVCALPPAITKDIEAIPESYERGAICFGEESAQIFDDYNDFVPDQSILIEPITIEFKLRTKPMI